MERRGLLQSIMTAVAAAWAGPRVLSGETAQRGPTVVAPTKHIRVYVEMDVPPAREREMLDLFHNQFVPEAVKHEGFIRVRMLKRRTVLLGTAPSAHIYRFELEFESEELRQKWATSAAHQRVWPPVEKTMATATNYPVLLYDEI